MNAPAQPLSLSRAPSDLSRARRATRVQFAALGVLGGSWGVHIPSVKSEYGLDEATLSMVLLAAALGAVIALFFAGRVVARLGARGAVAVGGLIMCTVLSLVLTLPGLAVLLPAMVVFGAAMSLFDVSINSEGTELETLSGRTIMSNLHGMFSVGGMLGAAITAAMLNHGVPALTQLVAISGLLALVIVATSRGMLDTHPSRPEAGSQATFAWPRGLLLVIGLLIFAGMTAEGVMYDWCVLYLKQDIGLPQAQAAIGYATFSGAMAVSRFAGDTLRSRYSERALLLCGASLSAVAMAVVLLVGNAWVALIGFALVGAGLAPVVPILFNAATRVPGVSRAAAIAAVSSIGYSGFMIGPPLIGGIAQHSSLTWALSVLVLASALLALGARYVPAKPAV